MKHWVSRLGLFAICTAIALPTGAVAEPFTFDPQQMPETVGTPRDPAERQAAMGALQKALAAQQVTRGLRAEATIDVTAAERKSIDETPTAKDGRLLVGLNKAVGVTVSFAGAENLGTRTRDLKLGAARGDGQGGFTWTASLRSPGAEAMRVHVTGLDLPEGASLFVYNEKGQAFGPYTGRGPLDSGDLFTNTVFGEQLILQLRAPAGALVPAFRVEEVGVMGKRFLMPRYSPQGVFDPNDLDSLANAKAFCSYNASCVVNAACQSSAAVNAAKDAVATMLFGSGGGQYICTGQLIADTVSTSVIPYFLTAHHCIGSSGEASSLETYFDYQTTCSSPNCTQPYNNTGETVGSTIKATGSSSDYSLLQLSSAPTTPDGVATYLGWDATAIANTTTQLYRVSHPKGAPQAYSEQRVDPTKPTCGTLPRGRFLYSKDNLGATEGGSSGSAVVDGTGKIVGQLYGACGTNLNNVCDANNNATVDGAFANTYPAVAAFLNPGGGGSCTPAGQSCSSNSQCCSNNCKGKPGAQTCK